MVSLPGHWCDLRKETASTRKTQKIYSVAAYSGGLLFNICMCAVLNFFSLRALGLKKKKSLCCLGAPPLTCSSLNPEVMNWHWRPPSLRYVIKSSHQLIRWRNMPSDYTQSSLSECPCPYVPTVTKAKVLPSPDIALQKVKLNKRA